MNLRLHFLMISSAFTICGGIGYMQQNSGSFNYELPYSSESIFNHNHLTTITEDQFKYTTYL